VIEISFDEDSPAMSSVSTRTMARLTKKTAAQLTAYLADLPSERLVELVMSHAEQDVELRTELLQEAASAGGGPLDVSSYRRSFSDALQSGRASRRDDARTSGSWDGAVMGVVGQIGDLLPDHPAAVIDITGYALGRVDVTMTRVDDSSGWFSQITSELENLHHRACEIARPDPVALARWLFALEVDSEWDILHDAPNRYAAALATRPTPINRYVAARVPAPATHDDLIAVLAWEGRLDAAWAVADQHGASLSVWMDLATTSETDRPLDAARAHARDVAAQIDRKRDDSAVQRLTAIRTLHGRGGDPSGFETYLSDLRHRHRNRQKTKSIRLLDEAGLR
jgi:hypothetical protein